MTIQKEAAAVIKEMEAAGKEKIRLRLVAPAARKFDYSDWSAGKDYALGMALKPGPNISRRPAKWGIGGAVLFALAMEVGTALLIWGACHLARAL